MTVIIIFLSYILGCLPFGYLFAKVFYRKNLLEIGSGKIGMTNVIRATNVKIGILVLICDVSKGSLAVLISQWLVDSAFVMVLSGIAVNVGHNWSILLKFRGGRGVLTASGSMLVMIPPATILGAIIGLTVIAVTKYGSLGSFSAMTTAFIVAIIGIGLGYYDSTYLVYAIFMFCFLILRHKDNMGRLAKGKETKINSASNDHKSNS